MIDHSRPRAPTCGTATATGYLDFSSQLVNTNIGHQHPKVVAAIQEQAAKLCTIAPAARQRRPLRGRPADRRAHPGRPRTRSSSPTAAPTPSSTPSGWPGCTPAATRCSSRYRSLPRRHRHRGQPDRRPAPLAQRLRQQPASCTSSARSSTARRSTPTTEEEECERALEHLEQRDPARGPVDDRGDRPRVDPRHRGHHGAAARATWPACARSATATASCSSPTR